MTISPVTYTVQAAPLTANFTANVTQSISESASAPVSLGNLQQESSIIQLSDQGTSSGAQSQTFTLKSGDNIYFDPSFQNVVDESSTHLQVIDSQNNVIADNQGTQAQQEAYTQLFSAGLSPGAGNYTVVVTPSTYIGAPDLQLNVLQQQGTSLSVNSSLNATLPTDYYNFSLADSGNLKLAFNTDNSSNVRVQIYAPTTATDYATGKTVASTQLIADSQGTAQQQQAYAQLTSGAGLSGVADGTYSVAVSYADGVTPTDNGLKYNFQFYSGTNYAAVYQTNAAAPSGASVTAAKSVTAGSSAQAYAQTAYHTLNETASGGVAIGYLKQDKSSLSVTSLLTPVDSTDYYSFILQQGSTNLKLSLSNLTSASNTNAVHLQILNSTGGKVIADNQGTPAQQAAFAQLTSSKGLTATPGTYVVKATYGQGAAKSENLEYNVQLYSGTSYSALYKTTASAQTYENAVINGNISGGYNAATATAAYLNTFAGNSSSSSDTLTNLNSALSGALQAGV